MDRISIKCPIQRIWVWQIKTSIIFPLFGNGNPYSHGSKPLMSNRVISYRSPKFLRSAYPQDGCQLCFYTESQCALMEKNVTDYLLFYVNFSIRIIPPCRDAFRQSLCLWCLSCNHFFRTLNIANQFCWVIRDTF